MTLPDVRKAPSILVIDDQPMVRRMAHRLLSEWGFRVFEAESGEEGMEVAHPAEVLMQYGLTRLDAPFLAKPFTRDELLTKVSEALAVPTPTSTEGSPR